MKIKILVVEDEVLIAEDLAEDLRELGFEVVDIAISGEECLAAIDKYRPDVIIMDILIKGAMTGIDVANQLKSSHPIPIIYLTSNTDHTTLKSAIASLPYSIMSKPYNRTDLKSAINLAFAKHSQDQLSLKKDNNQKVEAIFLKRGEVYEKVELNNIKFIEAAGSYCTVHTDNGEYILSSNLQNFENKMAHRSFLRIHRSCIVNVNKVTGIDSYSVYIDKKQLPVSKPHRDVVNQMFFKL